MPGGKREGAGRKSAAQKALTDEELKILREGLVRDLPGAAAKALEVLQKTLQEEKPDAARVTAAKYLIDRVLGRPREQPLAGFEALERNLLELQKSINEEELRGLRLKNRLLELEAEGKGIALETPPFDPLAAPPKGE